MVNVGMNSFPAKGGRLIPCKSNETSLPQENQTMENVVRWKRRAEAVEQTAQQGISIRNGMVATLHATRGELK